MKKRISYALMASMLAGVVSGCSGNSTNTPGGDTANKNGDKTEGNPASAAVELKMWVHETNEKEDSFYRERIASFNKAHEGKIKVTLQGIPRGQSGTGYEDKINASIAAGELPDLLDLDGPNAAAYAKSGVIAPLDEHITKADLTDFVESIIQQGTYNNKLYMLGAMEASVVLYYNKKALEEAGIPIAKSVSEAWTMDQFYEYAKKLKKGDSYPVNFFMNYGVNEWQTFMGAPFVWSNGGDLIAADGSTTEGKLNSPETAEALTMIGKFFKDGLATLTPGEKDWEEQKSVLALGGPWIAGDTKGYEWGMMPMPKFDVAKSPSGSWGYAITTQTKHPKEAAEVVKWMTNVETAVGLSNVTGMPPSRKSAFDQLPQYNEYPQKIIMEQLKNTAQARPRTPAYPMLSKEFAMLFYAAAAGEDIKPLLNEAVKRIDQSIKRASK
ncbi:ABC transporter substrate-binding protein [Paenibacillus puerhi]|uniref:ABC transporter substrate-binding protein n=1 Tax=Paenibacillus puerhi TaxID=2692622 RepID=UPI001358AB83|nr:sugar ABC transporter substrate-binding protein [Paenibacillus puerhi]